MKWTDDELTMAKKTLDKVLDRYRYKIGWYDERQGKWRYITVDTEEEAFGEFSDKILLSNKVSFRRIKRVKLGG